MNKNKILLILFCIYLPFFLILSAYKTSLLFIDLTPEQKNVFDFLEGKSQLEEGFTKNEVSHLEDVKKVMEYSNYFFYFLLLVLTLILTSYKNDQKELLKQLKYGGITTIALVFFILIASLASFDHVFSIFHQIFFPQGNWTFPFDSRLIQTFPLQFFITISKKIFFTSLVLGIIFILAALYLKYVYGKRD
ncbi:MAG: DUF1461 domain-containing protein [Nanoarchaeota archaeon]|nr:DUF1461 domain-containing protein [Nanoarchaeota archaeon]MBU1643896.1 DUF1461 domain-containing protein [Nanoarchaeota archaeon]MBU1976394.1 DUF1461 domain-containing protein [Nanoarchaeota archaeon]